MGEVLYMPQDPVTKFRVSTVRMRMFARQVQAEYGARFGESRRTEDRADRALARYMSDGAEPGCHLRKVAEAVGAPDHRAGLITWLKGGIDNGK